jgi:3-oxoacyl-[acyl-carrier-protein] synthase II
VPAGRVGVYVGTTMGESAVFEAAGEGAELALDEAAGSVFAAEVAETLELEGPRRTYGTACAAGNYALGAAAVAVRSGAVDAAIAGGVEPFSRIALLGFARSRAMSSDLCRPFDASRSGMQLGEAAAFLVLEREDRARARDAAVLAAVTGFGLSGDAFHPTAPRDDGSGMAAAMRACLAAAAVPAAEVGWVCAHGTGTARSDAAEANALHEVFGERPPPVSSVKGALGHSLGAATAVQAVVAVLALRGRLLPPNANLEQLDESLGLDVPTEPRAAPGLRRVLSCGYAFGGLNSALLLEAA